MSEESTQNLNGGRSFEDRVFARFDAVDTRFDAVDSAIRDLGGRVQNLESRSYDTKPIWERALKEILDTRRELGETRGEIVESRRELTETKHKLIKLFDRMLSITVDTREDMEDVHDRLNKVEAQQLPK